MTALTITKMLCPESKYNIKCPYLMKPSALTRHDTANKASAMAEVSYMIGNNNEVSYHYAVDDYRAVQGIPDNRNAWHCGDGGNGKGNRHSLGFETCYSLSGGEKYQKSCDNVLTLMAMKMKEYSIPITQVFYHKHWNGKNCPHNLLGQGVSQDLFRKQLELRYAEMYGGGNVLNITTKPATTTKEESVDVIYRVKTQKHGWLGEITNYSDEPVNGYAGWEDSPITGVALKVNKGKVKYRVHVLGGGWLGWISQYNVNDYHNGYAGNGKPIDAIQIYYYTPDGMKLKEAVYKVNNFGWQHDTSTAKGMDGYAGLFGKAITKLRVAIKDCD